MMSALQVDDVPTRSSLPSPSNSDRSDVSSASVQALGSGAEVDSSTKGRGEDKRDDDDGLEGRGSTSGPSSNLASDPDADLQSDLDLDQDSRSNISEAESVTVAIPTGGRRSMRPALTEPQVKVLRAELLEEPSRGSSCTNNNRKHVAKQRERRAEQLDRARIAHRMEEARKRRRSGGATAENRARKQLRLTQMLQTNDIGAGSSSSKDSSEDDQPTNKEDAYDAVDSAANDAGDDTADDATNKGDVEEIVYSNGRAASTREAASPAPSAHDVPSSDDRSSVMADSALPSEHAMAYAWLQSNGGAHIEARKRSRMVNAALAVASVLALQELQTILRSWRVNGAILALRMHADDDDVFCQKSRFAQHCSYIWDQFSELVQLDHANAVHAIARRIKLVEFAAEHDAAEEYWPGQLVPGQTRRSAVIKSISAAMERRYEEQAALQRSSVPADQERRRRQHMTMLSYGGRYKRLCDAFGRGILALIPQAVTAYYLEQFLKDLLFDLWIALIKQCRPRAGELSAALWSSLDSPLHDLIAGRLAPPQRFGIEVLQDLGGFLSVNADLELLFQPIETVEASTDGGITRPGTAGESNGNETWLERPFGLEAVTALNTLETFDAGLIEPFMFNEVADGAQGSQHYGLT